MFPFCFTNTFYLESLIHKIFLINKVFEINKSNLKMMVYFFKPMFDRIKHFFSKNGKGINQVKNKVVQVAMEAVTC